MTYFASVEVLESRAERSIHVVVLSHEAPLSPIRQLVELVSPMTAVPEPACWGIRVLLCRLKDICHGLEWKIGGCRFRILVIGDADVVVVAVVVEGRIPQWPFVCNICEKPEWKNIWMLSRCGVHCMTAYGAV